MRRYVTWAVGVGLLLAAVGTAVADDAQDDKKSARPKVVDPAAVVYDADTAFEFIKGMAGQWQRAGGKDHGDGSSATTFKVSAAGSAVIETIFPGSETEMVTVYHRNGKELLLTHYCALYNAPVLKFEPSDKPGEIKFAFEGGTNFDPAKDLHVHEGILKVKDANTLELTFTAFANGKPQPADSATLRRKDAK